MRRRRRHKKKTKTEQNYIKPLTKIVIALIGFAISIWIMYLFRVERVSFEELKRHNSLIIEESTDTGYLILNQLDKNDYHFISFPLNIKVPFAYGYGNYNLQVVRELGEQEKLDQRLAHYTIQNWLGVDIHTVIILEAKTISDIRSLSPLGEISNLTQVERLWWIKNHRTILKSSPVSIEREGFLQTSDTNELEFSELQLQEFRKEYVFDSIIAAIPEQIAVVNATSINGVGTEVSEKLRAMGFDVTVVSDSNEAVEKSKILVDSSINLDKDVEVALRNYFGEVEITSQPQVTQKYRADIAIILGDSYRTLIYGD